MIRPLYLADTHEFNTTKGDTIIPLKGDRVVGDVAQLIVSGRNPLYTAQPSWPMEVYTDQTIMYQYDKSVPIADVIGGVAMSCRENDSFEVCVSYNRPMSITRSMVEDVVGTLSTTYVFAESCVSTDTAVFFVCYRPESPLDGDDVYLLRVVSKAPSVTVEVVSVTQFVGTDGNDDSQAYAMTSSSPINVCVIRGPSDGEKTVTSYTYDNAWTSVSATAAIPTTSIRLSSSDGSHAVVQIDDTGLAYLDCTTAVMGPVDDTEDARKWMQGTYHDSIGFVLMSIGNDVVVIGDGSAFVSYALDGSGIDTTYGCVHENGTYFTGGVGNTVESLDLTTLSENTSFQTAYTTEGLEDATLSTIMPSGIVGVFIAVTVEDGDSHYELRSVRNVDGVLRVTNDDYAVPVDELIPVGTSCGFTTKLGYRAYAWGGLSLPVTKQLRVNDGDGDTVESTGLSTAEIFGIVIGSIAAAALIALLVWWS